MTSEVVDSLADLTNDKLGQDLASAEREQADLGQILRVRQALESELAGSLIKARALGSQSNADSAALPLMRVRAEVAEGRKHSDHLQARSAATRAEIQRRKGADQEAQRKAEIDADFAPAEVAIAEAYIFPEHSSKWWRNLTSFSGTL